MTTGIIILLVVILIVVSISWLRTLAMGIEHVWDEDEE